MIISKKGPKISHIKLLILGKCSIRGGHLNLISISYMKCPKVQIKKLLF